MSWHVVVFILNIVAECLKRWGVLFSFGFFFKFCVGFLVINWRDFVCRRHSGSNLNSPEVSGIKLLLVPVLIFAISSAFLTAKLS